MSFSAAKFVRSIAWLCAAVCGGATVCSVAAQTPSATTPPAPPQQPQDPTAIARELLTPAAEDAATSNGEGPAGIVPFQRGFNATLITASQHDSAGGWTNVLTPNVAYRFNRHFSVNVGLPVYTYINVAVPVSQTVALGQVISTTYGLTTKLWELGDTEIAGEFEAHPRLFDYFLDGTLAAPSGDDAHALGAGRPTYFVTNHFERAVSDHFAGLMELGIGNSLNLTNTRIHESYIQVGTNAHFQLGATFWLPLHANFTSAAYEDMPLATQTVTSVTTNGKKGKQLKLITTSTEKSLGEDNGFLNTLDIPITGHMTLSGFYNRSLRDKNDTAGFSFTFFLRSTKANESGAQPGEK